MLESSQGRGCVDHVERSTLRHCEKAKAQGKGDGLHCTKPLLPLQTADFSSGPLLVVAPPCVTFIVVVVGHTPRTHAKPMAGQEIVVDHVSSVYNCYPSSINIRQCSYPHTQCSANHFVNTQLHATGCCMLLKGEALQVSAAASTADAHGGRRVVVFHSHLGRQ
jgi:hypothetical protein